MEREKLGRTGPHSLISPSLNADSELLPGMPAWSIWYISLSSQVFAEMPASSVQCSLSIELCNPAYPDGMMRLSLSDAI